MDERRQERWHMRFSGHVQHVGFRYTAMALANRLYLTGWVDNLPNGQVEMEAQGGAAQLRRLIMQLKSIPHIHIEKIDIQVIPVIPHDRHFEVRGY